ncbi:interferon-induced protein 44 [Amia ocellicauda]|uniref:interferon-induced protein 44 n=1 Tax=Amia ocellicauda TaxID=2972642 RepID=UPI00346455E6
MGGSQSTPTPQPCSLKEFTTQWRTIPWGKAEKQRLMEEIRNLKPPQEESPEFRILTYGQISAGKSSFLNTVGSIFQDRLVSRAIVGVGSTSVTKKFTPYRLRDKKTGSNLSVALCDIMGMETRDGLGIHPDDIISAAKGHIKDGYQFNPVSPLKPDPRKRPPVTDQAHCIIYIVAADQLSLLSDNILHKMKRVRDELNDMGLPQLVLLTKVDLACPLVKENLRNVYKSSYIKQQIEKCSQTVGIPANHILPVKNYHEESSLNDDLDVLILSALLQTLHFASDYIENMQQAQEEFKEEEWRQGPSVKEEKERLMEKIRSLKPPGHVHSEFKILMHGQISAGKSSFLNTVGSIFQERVVSRAVVGMGGTSVTKKFTPCYLKDKKTGSNLPFVLCDIMGLETADWQGIHPDDIISAAKGYIKSGYKFNPVSPLKPDTSKRPPVKDQAHCIIYVVAADQLSLLSDNILDKLKRVRKVLTDMGLPQVVLLTKVDLACPLVKEDLCNVYKSIYIKQQMKKCSQMLDIPVSNILAVKNYHEETSLNDNLDILVLSALLQILQFASDRFVLQGKAH